MESVKSSLLALEMSVCDRLSQVRIRSVTKNDCVNSSYRSYQRFYIQTS